MSCRKASYIIEKRTVSRISVWEKIGLKLHLMICHLCRKYESDSRILGKLLKSLQGHKKHEHLTESQKEAIKKKITSV